MFEEKEKEWILEAINHLKHRKARPDVSRISLRMKRKYLMSFAQTTKLLDSLIESGVVVKAVYKNNTSYRDVSKWKKGRLGGHILNSNKMLKRFIRAIESLEKTKGTGVSAQDIEDFLASQGEEKCFLSGAALKDALENEISNGYLKKLNTGSIVHYTINKEKSDSVLNLLEDSGEDNDNSIIKNEVIEDTPDNSFEGNSSHDKSLLLSDIISAIHETEQTEGSGSTLLDIKEILLMKSFSFSDDDALFEILGNEVAKGTLNKIKQKTLHLYAVNEKYDKVHRADYTTASAGGAEIEMNGHHVVNVDNDSKIKKSGNNSKDYSCMTNLSKVKTQTENIVADTQQVHCVPLRPPSKRKRIMKDHGPDFEIEFPTKVKPKITEDIKESIYPTPTNSPASEKSATSIYQSFNFDRKKRGRPKKMPSPSTSCNNSMDPLGEDSRQGTFSENSTTFVEDGEESVGPMSLYADISSWSTEQVAEYFSSKGYLEEAQSMLEHDLDGIALSLLRRSDIVGPPLGGILKVKKLGVALKLFRDIRNLLYQGNADNYMDPYEEKPFMRS